MTGDSLQLALCRACLEHVGDGYGGVAVGEVWVVPATAHRDAEPVARHAGKGHIVELPYHPLPTLCERENR